MERDTRGKICWFCFVLIDVDGKRVVRVNDVQLIEAAGDWRVTGADVSLQGLYRRLAPAGFMGTRKPVEVLDWAARASDPPRVDAAPSG